MVFSDQSFVFLFMPIAILTCIAVLRTRLFHLAILFFSLTFFYWSSGALTLILIFSITLNYAGAYLIHWFRRRWVIGLLIFINIAVLAYFKYTYFVLGTAGFFGSEEVGKFAASIILPIGISFYTFQGVSYLIDVWRREVPPEPNIITFAAYQAFFPQLIAGPIVRYVDVTKDLHSPKFSADNFAAGAARFVLGLSKKVLVADAMASVAEAAFSQGTDLSFASAWLGAIAFTIQIYFDFSGYSDMAIGIALMFGVRFRENFNHPYAASTITEFWRRWHMSLSSWFRDYLYIPLGGNRLGAGRTYANLLIVFVATGIWHGAAWTFLLWGLYNGAFLILERLFLPRRLDGSIGMRMFYFFPVVIVGWALFQSPDLATFGTFVANMATPFTVGAFSLPPEMMVAFTPYSIAIFAFAIAAILMQGYARPAGVMLENATTPLAKFGRLSFIVTLAAVCMIFVLTQRYSPFLYFRF